MKAVSKFVLALAFSSLPLTASIAFAEGDAPKKEKPKKEKKPKKGEEAAAGDKLQLNLSKEFLAAYQPVVNAYSKARGPEAKPGVPLTPEALAMIKAAAAAAAPSWSAIKAAVMNDDDRYQAGVFGAQIGGETNNAVMMAEAVDLAIASTTTPANIRPNYIFNKATRYYDAQDWANAEIWLLKALEANYQSKTLEGGIEFLMANTTDRLQKYPESLAWFEKSSAASKNPGAVKLPANFYLRAVNVALKSKDVATIGRWMGELVRSNPRPDYWHDAIVQTYSAARQSGAAIQLGQQEELDLFRLLRKAGGMKYERNYSDYASDEMIARFPTEMKLVLEEGFASGTISKDNATFGGKYLDVQENLKISPFSASILDQDIASAKTGGQKALAGDVALSVGEYAKAAAAYEAAIAMGDVRSKDGDDLTERTNLRLGMAKAMLGDITGAKAVLAKVVTPSRKVVADFWNVYIDTRGAPATKPAA